MDVLSEDFPFSMEVWTFSGYVIRRLGLLDEIVFRSLGFPVLADPSLVQSSDHSSDAFHGILEISLGSEKYRSFFRFYF